MSTKSVELSDLIREETRKTLEMLDKIWDEMGIDVEIRAQREQVVHKHVCELYNDMVTEAIESRTELRNSIDILLKDINVLKNDLNENISIIDHDKLPLYEVKHRLKKQLATYQHIYAARKAELNDLFKREKELCRALNKETVQLPLSPLPSAEEISKFRMYLEELSDEKFRKEEIFLKTKASILEIINELRIRPSLDFERKVIMEEDSAFQVSDSNMEMLEKFYKSLVQQQEETKAKISELRERVSTLWERLEESPAMRSAFLEANPGNSLDTLQALKQEVARCEEKKKANIKIFVVKMRDELYSWWEKCRFSPEQRADFLHFESDCYTEDLLALHEMEVDKLKAFYETNKHIFELCIKREKLWEKMIELENRAKQPDRYKNRGGQLLREEKERKSIASQLPKIEKEILELVQEYESQTGSAFKINGEHLNDIITRDWEEHKENRHIMLSARKQAREHATMTPSKIQLTPNTIRLTPAISATKRKFNTPLTSNKRTRLFNDKMKSAPPKILINGSVIKRASLERRRKFERSKIRTQLRRDKGNSVESIASNYDCFELGLQTNSTYRSTLFEEKNLAKPNGFVTPIKTPRKVLQTVTNTPQLQRTPSKMNLRSKSPGATPRLAAAPGNLPIII